MRFAGARMLYKNLPKTVGLRRLTLHKSRTLHSAEVTYLLLVECTHFMDHIGEAANLLPILRDESHLARWLYVLIVNYFDTVGIAYCDYPGTRPKIVPRQYFSRQYFYSGKI